MAVPTSRSLSFNSKTDCDGGDDTQRRSYYLGMDLVGLTSYFPAILILNTQTIELQRLVSIKYSWILTRSYSS